MPEKIVGSLTSSILKSVYTLISPIFSYKLCSVATPGYPEPLLLENQVRIVALTPSVMSQDWCHAMRSTCLPDSARLHRLTLL